MPDWLISQPQIGNFSQSLLKLLRKNFNKIEVQIKGILFALKDVINTIDEDVGVQKGNLSHVSISLGPPGDYFPLVWKGFVAQIKSMSDFEEKLKTQLIRVIFVKKEMSVEVSKMFFFRKFYLGMERSTGYWVY